jgi:hydrogenase nickel incorporation protein HypA/HybF
MHELSLCQALIEQVEAIAREQAAHQVLSIHLAIGPLSGVEPQLLEQALPFASAGTIAAGAGLVIDYLPVRVRCQACGDTTEAMPSRLSCGNCGDSRTALVSGDELLLMRVELAVAAENQRREDARCATPAAAT